MAAAAERFVRHRVEVVEPNNGQYMMVADPDGLIIEIWQAEPEEEVGRVLASPSLWNKCQVILATPILTIFS